MDIIGKKVRIKVPATTANLGPGFDTLGMALDLYMWIEMGVADKTAVHLIGDQMSGLPTGKSNLVYQVAQQVFAKAGVEHPELEISMYSDIPLTRGLGSSASAIIGGMAAANALIGSPLSDDTLFQMATALEEHPDNVGPALFGGLVVAFWDGARAEHIRVEPDDRLEALVAIPHFELLTEKARQVLPREQSLANAVYNVGHSSVLVAAFCTGRLDMIAGAMKDALHQPYRAPLVPGLSKILAEATDHGALGVALSGAGPTMLALVERGSSRKAELEAFLLGTLKDEGIEATLMWLKPDKSGVQVLTHFDESCTLFENIKGEVRA
ncbi:homoserine kinase [Paenibacillus doosanensis]|uniref:Homoserine kinase n=1 Tax=Paenibacillus konkukensis TaxID=2020716 RepID=A0ABY4RXN9_9BACL|nr:MULTISPECIES: homoserine kinase [Paenibacillus]MCS7458708.1 homoserine kinase [Paenibacillus doosanensis]UQZ86768.1 Homoserine kinase [Paenibacillus konkukensis]